MEKKDRVCGFSLDSIAKALNDRRWKEFEVFTFELGSAWKRIGNVLVQIDLYFVRALN